MSTSAPEGMIGSRTTLLTKEGMRFLIMDQPRTHNLHLYVKEFKKHNVTDVVRVCEPTYAATDLKNAGIALHEMPYPDGHSPPDHILDKWLKLVDERLIHSKKNRAIVSENLANGVGANHESASTTIPTIAVHCVAGLGRAPVLVAIALIEFANMEAVDAATLIRRHRRGAINNTQLDWLERYKRRYNRVGDSCCIVM